MIILKINDLIYQEGACVLLNGAHYIYILAYIEFISEKHPSVDRVLKEAYTSILLEIESEKNSDYQFEILWKNSEVRKLVRLVKEVVHPMNSQNKIINQMKNIDVKQPLWTTLFHKLFASKHTRALKCLAIKNSTIFFKVPNNTDLLNFWSCSTFNPELSIEILSQLDYDQYKEYIIDNLKEVMSMSSQDIKFTKGIYTTLFFILFGLRDSEKHLTFSEKIPELLSSLIGDFIDCKNQTLDLAITSTLRILQDSINYLKNYSKHVPQVKSASVKDIVLVSSKLLLGKFLNIIKTNSRKVKNEKLLIFEDNTLYVILKELLESIFNNSKTDLLSKQELFSGSIFALFQFFGVISDAKMAAEYTNQPLILNFRSVYDTNEANIRISKYYNQITVDIFYFSTFNDQNIPIFYTGLKSFGDIRNEIQNWIFIDEIKKLFDSKIKFYEDWLLKNLVLNGSNSYIKLLDNWIQIDFESFNLIDKSKRAISLINDVNFSEESNQSAFRLFGITKIIQNINEFFRQTQRIGCFKIDNNHTNSPPLKLVIEKNDTISHYYLHEYFEYVFEFLGEIKISYHTTEKFEASLKNSNSIDKLLSSVYQYEEDFSEVSKSFNNPARVQSLAKERIYEYNFTYLDSDQLSSNHNILHHDILKLKVMLFNFESKIAIKSDFPCQKFKINMKSFLSQVIANFSRAFDGTKSFDKELNFDINLYRTVVSKFPYTFIYIWKNSSKKTNSISNLSQEHHSFSKN